MITPTMLWSG